MAKQFFSNLAADSFAVGKHRLQVHWLPDRASLNVVPLKPTSKPFAVRTELIGRDRDAGQPARMTPPFTIAAEPS